ncbi:LPXTG cell wall anchor domain-containing protein [Limosilactobacillus reuteri]|nr:LPXTG cell wall anchor domain-containing protein [Limosilactobacillus reuteri]QIZ05265.1 LPXTG cell wall anchor domain-containing protein [Limosilactobacillus reuteri]
MNGNTAKSGSKNNSLKTLPQTGNGANEKASALGFLFAGLASIFSLAGRRKKKY